jgi:hypothetical protein
MDSRYHSNLLPENYKINFQPKEKGLNQIPYVCLCVFALLRPIMCIQYFTEIGILGINFLELFSVSISYILIIVSLFNIYRLRLFPINFSFLIGILFCLYLLFTLATGSYLRETIRLILPFAIFIAMRTIVTNEKQIVTLIILILVSYIIPLLGSSWLILIGESIGKTIYQTGLIRYEGMYLKVHTLAHSMFVFIFMLLLYLNLSKNELKNKKVILYLIYFLCFIAIFNLFKSYTRNVWIGLFILLIFYFWGQKKYLVIAALIFVILIIAKTSSNFNTIFFDFIEPLSGERDISGLGAGRLGMWSSVIKKFNTLSWEVKFMGVGIGEAKRGFGISRGHNDFLSLLYSTGYIGFFLYITFLFRVGYDIFRSHIQRQLKYIFLGFLFAVIFMNIASNSYLSRVEMGQYFYFILGSFYVLNDRMNKTK